MRRNIQKMKKFRVLAGLVILLFAFCLLGLHVFNYIVGNPKVQFIRDFQLDLDENQLVFEELFNDYGGFPYEGMAMYKITLDNDAAQELSKWERLPLSENADSFMTSISGYVSLPEIADGYWMFVNRNQETKYYTNISICVYDPGNKVAYLITYDS